MARTPEARLAGQRPLIAVVATVVLLSGVAMQLDARGAATGGAQGTGDPAAAEPGRAPQVVGPARGAQVTAYVADRQVALAEAPAEVDTAVVSFASLQTVASAQLLVGDALDVRAALVRLPLSGAEPFTVVSEGDLVAGVEAALAARVEPLVTEEAETRSLLEDGSVTDPAFLADYEQRVAELAAAIDAARAGAPVVHAVVVRGTLQALLALESVPEVRLVDPAPPGTDVATSVFHGLLPSDDDVTSFGRTA